MGLEGTHPELVHLLHIIEHRRQARLALIEKLLQQGNECGTRQAEAEYRCLWYDWGNGRYELRKSMLDEANIKKRSLDREKRSIERPRNGEYRLSSFRSSSLTDTFQISEDLSTVLRTHAPPRYLYFGRRSAASYGQVYSTEIDAVDGLQKKRKHGAVGLNHDEALYDLERMGVRLAL